MRACTPDDCSGTNDFSDQFEFTGPTASVSVDLGATAHARVMLRVALYDDDFAYVEGGLKAYAKAGVWGYLGNACGDADGDGDNETVRALVADLSWGYQLAYGWGGWALPDRVRYAGTHDDYLAWRDLLGNGGSTALQPMILGPSSVAEGATATYTVKLRPCYKYANAVNLSMAPGTWTGGTSIAWIQKAETSWGPAGTLTAAGYAANGTGTVQLVWRERSTAGVWGAWFTVPFQATPAADTTWSNTISSGSPTNACHWFDASTVYSGVTSAVIHFTGVAGCP